MNLNNIIIVFGILIVLATGVYLYRTQGGELFLSGSAGVTDTMLATTELYIERSAALDALTLERSTSLVTSPTFLSLRSFSGPILERPVGRGNPFAPPVVPTR